MLKEIEFYRITSLEILGEGQVNAKLRLNPGHHIFNGHFPETPVVPGVCMLTMAKEILETHLQRTLQLRSAGNIKFLKLLSPVENPDVELMARYSVQEGQVGVTEVQISAGENVFVKLTKAIYQ